MHPLLKIAHATIENPTIGHATFAQQIAEAASACEERRTGYRPKSAKVVLSDDMLAITLRDALAPADKSTRRTPPQVARFRDSHRGLFADSISKLVYEIKRITGVDVCQASAEIHIVGQDADLFATGTIVQMFLLVRTVGTDCWSGDVQERSWENSA